MRFGLPQKPASCSLGQWSGKPVASSSPFTAESSDGNFRHDGEVRVGYCILQLDDLLWSAGTKLSQVVPKAIRMALPRDEAEAPMPNF